uniref:Protein phosphatase 1 regulatory subunit 16A-like n=1 Tax=Saccoglossus kowalevskii TaxID=10224 RepID=A0ABM0MDA3_SACKO|nr:PREDICTED: protein phosphatase 1 regulatory subunit 16A-like [Saccoglossus kowalevskii]
MDLATAAANGDLESIKSLIHSGVNLNQRSREGFAPLCTAAFWGYSDIVQYLLKNGASVNCCNSGTGWTALHCAAFQGHGKVIMKIMDHNPDLTLRDDKGRTASDFASAIDAIWPFFAAAGCKRTPKTDLIRLDVIKKVHEDAAIPKSDYSFYSRPGSAYVMQPQPMRGSVTRTTGDEKRDYAAATGDVLALRGEGIPASNRHSTPSFNIWRN